MRHSEFTIGGAFWCGGRQWRCTDIGTRLAIAIRIDSVDVASNVPELRRTLSRGEAEADGWFNGPPYAVAESVFDEYDQQACSLEPDPDEASPVVPDNESGRR
jgi:hypothetical protein